MPRKVQVVTNMEIDEVSMVDRAACPPAAIVFSKRADQEESMDEYADADGNPLDLSQFGEGDVLEDEDGNQFVVSYEADDDDDDDGSEWAYADQGDLVGIGKSAFGGYGYDSVASIRSALSKAVSEDDRNHVMSKALTSLSKRAEDAEARAFESELIAKGEQDLRLEREYIGKAAEYNVPIAPDELGPVLMRMVESMDYDDCAVIHKALAAAGEMLYVEAGFDGSGVSDDPMDQVEEYLSGFVAKGEGSQAGLMTDFFDNNPEAYDALRSARI